MRVYLDWMVVWVSFFGTIIARKRDSQYYTCAVLFNLTLRPGRHGTHETAFITETIDGSIGWLAVACMRSSAWSAKAAINIWMGLWIHDLYNEDSFLSCLNDTLPQFIHSLRQLIYCLRFQYQCRFRSLWWSCFVVWHRELKVQLHRFIRNIWSDLSLCDRSMNDVCHRWHACRLSIWRSRTGRTHFLGAKKKQL